MKYRVEFEYNVPEWAEFEITSDSPVEAEAFARSEFEEMYPEATDSKVIGVYAIA